jgi:WD40 repeat protein
MRRFWRFLAFCLVAVFAAHAARASDLANMGAAEIKALQQRLADGGCYQGAIDGQASPALEAAIKACPSQDPVLRIETGMHVAQIQRIGVDRACRIAATGSVDKTVRLWSLPDGRLLRTLRVPIGPGLGGRIFAVAISPDGHWIAAGGYDAQWSIANGMYVYVFDASTGVMVTRVGPFGNVFDSLAFSPDGRWLAATSFANVGLKVIDVRNWRVAVEDKDYAGDSYGAAFAPDGRLYTVAYDGKLRQYGPAPDFKKEREVATKGGGRPFSVAVDPRGQLVAVGFDASTGIDVYDASTLKFRLAADTKGLDLGDLSSVTWGSDGARLIAGGLYQAQFQGVWKRPLVIFDRDGKRIGNPLPLSDHSIFDLQPCGDAIAVASGDPAFGLVDGNGEISLWKTGVALDTRNKIGSAFTIAPNAKQIRIGLGLGAEDPVLFDLGQATVTSMPNAVPGFIAPVTEGLPVANWQNNDNPTFGGKPISLKQGEMSRSLAVRPGRTGFVLGAEFYLRAFDAGGKQLWAQAGPSIAWGVNISSDGRIIVAAYADGTVRWHRWSDGKELLALFINSKNKTWVAWTPTGYYMASPGGEDLIGWHLNRGWDQAADFFPASKFHDKYARTDIVERVLDTLDEDEAVRQADLARPRKAAAQAPIIESLPPVLSILSPADDSHVETEKLTIDYLVRSPSGTPIDGVEALINGAPAGARGTGDDSTVKKCLAETHGLGRTMDALQGCRGSLTIALPPGTTEIGLFARGSSKSSNIAEIRVTRTGPPTPAEITLKPKLYAFIAGISNYADPNYRLEFAAKDAHDFAGALANQNGALYSEVVIKLLVDQQATAVAIKDGLDWLTQQVTDRDVGVVYLAGHGIVDERDRFYFLAADSDPKRLLATAVAKDDIAHALDELAGKALLFLDACHAGSVANSSFRRSTYDNNDVVNDFLHSERGVVVFAASTGRQVSMEDPTWGNGAFTKALVEGLGSPGVSALAKIAGNNAITPAILDAYIAQRVKALTGGKQSPVMNSTAPDFPIAIVR